MQNLLQANVLSIINDSGHELMILYFTFRKNPKRISLVESIIQENRSFAKNKLPHTDFLAILTIS